MIELGQTDVVPAAHRASCGFVAGVFRERHRKQYRCPDAQWPSTAFKKLSPKGGAGSIPARTTAWVAQLAEHTDVDRGVAGSSPAPFRRLQSRLKMQVEGVIQRLAGWRLNVFEARIVFRNAACDYGCT